MNINIYTFLKNQNKLYMILYISYATKRNPNKNKEKLEKQKKGN